MFSKNIKLKDKVLEWGIVWSMVVLCGLETVLVHCGVFCNV